MCVCLSVANYAIIKLSIIVKFVLYIYFNNFVLLRLICNVAKDFRFLSLCCISCCILRIVSSTVCILSLSFFSHTQLNLQFPLFHFHLFKGKKQPRITMSHLKVSSTLSLSVSIFFFNNCTIIFTRLFSATALFVLVCVQCSLLLLLLRCVATCV